MLVLGCRLPKLYPFPTESTLSEWNSDRFFFAWAPRQPPGPVPPTPMILTKICQLLLMSKTPGLVLSKLTSSSKISKTSFHLFHVNLVFFPLLMFVRFAGPGAFYFPLLITFAAPSNLEPSQSVICKCFLLLPTINAATRYIKPGPPLAFCRPVKRLLSAGG